MPELIPLAHHPFLTALPFVGPMVIVVTFLVIMKIRDRREEASESEAEDRPPDPGQV